MWSPQAPCSVPPCSYLESLVVKEVRAVLCEVPRLHALSHLVLTSNPLWLRRSEQYCVKSQAPCTVPPCSYLNSLVVKEVGAVLCEVPRLHAQSCLVLTSILLWLRRLVQYCVKSQAPCSLPPCSYLESLVVKEVRAVLCEVPGSMLSPTLFLPRFPCG